MNTSVKMSTPCELLNITPLNPLISKCEIKVCYVGDEPNRNKSIITKEVATEMANSLPGSPIVGYYNESKGDFEEHNKIISIANGKLTLKDSTRPYGFVDLNARVWFQKYADNGVEHEYLMTEGWLWTGQYPEAKRIIEKGNNQSMELSDNFLDAVWSKDGNGKPQFFIINEAIISKLCILGEDCEPCFEGAQINAPTTFSLDEDFKVKIYSMMNEIKTLLQKGGNSPVNITTYAVEIGDALWCRVQDYLVEKYPDPECEYCTIYRIRGIFEEDGQKYVLLASRTDDTIYKMNFVIDGDSVIFGEELIAGTMEFVPEDGIKNEEEVDEYSLQYAANHVEAAEAEQVPAPIIEENTEDIGEPEVEGEPEIVAEPEVSAEPVVEDAPVAEETPVAYDLEKIPEYVELAVQYANLEKTNGELNNTIKTLETKISELTEFKKSIEKKEKQAMIDSFYMLSNEDKKDAQDNIDTYSLEDIEAKLSIICVRNRVNFNLEDNNSGSKPAPTTYTLQEQEIEDESVPAWLKRVREVAKNKNN